MWDPQKVCFKFRRSSLLPVQSQLTWTQTYFALRHSLKISTRYQTPYGPKILPVLIRLLKLNPPSTYWHIQTFPQTCTTPFETRRKRRNKTFLEGLTDKGLIPAVALVSIIFPSTPPETYFTVMDWSSASFQIHLHLGSQHLFTFTWENQLVYMDCHATKI